MTQITHLAINENLKLGGKHDDKINTYTEKVIDKVGAKNILKATSLFEKFKKCFVNSAALI